MKDKKRLLITKRQGKTVSLLIQDNRLVRAFAQKDGHVSLGDIVIGKVQHIVKNIQAAFVDMGGGMLCYLPIGDIRTAYLTNRSYDGRILVGDELVVQVCKEAVKTKEAVADTRLSFTGKYAVVTAGDGKESISYSAKIAAKDKQRIRHYLEAHNVEQLRGPFRIIIRTNAGTLADEALLLKEIELLTTQARQLLQKAPLRTCYSVLKKAPASFLTGLRDLYQEAYDVIMTDDPVLYQEVKEYLEANQPEDLEKLCFYEDTAVSMNSLYGIEAKLAQALNRQVWLPSGGYLVIEPTEALTVVDVNTGKYTGKKNTEETFFQINKEACEEMAIQIPLRNLSGIILVDFINMKEVRHQEELLRYFSQLLKKDAVKTSVIDMTPLGLVEITRKKVSKSLAEQFT